MVALLVRLKLTLLRNSLRRSVWRTVGLVLAVAYALGLVLVGLAGLVALRYASDGLTGDVTVVAFALLSLGWLVMSVLVFGVDETVDPARFALLPVRSRELLPGLLAAGLVGVPGLATALLGLGLVLTWARTPLLTLVAVLAAPLGVLTCVLLSRAATSTLAGLLATRRFRDLAFVLLALFAVILAVGANLGSVVLGPDPQQLRATLALAGTVAAWTPFGWAWAVPADVARGAWAAAGVHLVLGLSLAAGLVRLWWHSLDEQLVSVSAAASGGSRVGGRGRVDRLFPDSPSGAIAARTLRYWRRDPRYLAGAVGFVIAPLAILITQLVNPAGGGGVAMLTPVLLAFFVGLSVGQDLSFDGTALWTHVSAGVSGADDRRGRVLSAVAVYGPLLLVLTVVAVGFTGRWALLPAVVGLSVAVALVGLGAGCVVGALWQWAAPPPGANPFQKGSSGGLPALLSVGVTLAATVLGSLPTVAVALGSAVLPWLGWLVVPVGAANGLVAVRLGISRGGRLLDRRWPEALSAVSEKSD
ncbi:MAG: hypothetical protein JWP61_989 [Friedmanniella sp.]|nr:hypothetical protein [Friedmanniella sp.]